MPDHAEPAILPEPSQAVTELPGSLRIVALLALTGHDRREICHLLRIQDEALRQRLCALRRRLGEVEAGEPVADFVRLDAGLAIGTLRRALLPAVRLGGASFGSYDPDGHLFTVRISGRGPHKMPGGGNRAL